MFKNLTGYEIDSLPQAYNLTDGHVFRRWSATEEAVIDRSAHFFKNNSRLGQHEIERLYIQDFLLLARQTWNERDLGHLMCFTASMALEIVANYLRLNGLSLTLIEPCFDNLADTFQRHHIPMRPFGDCLLEADEDVFQDALSGIRSDAVCLVTPNNPTGNTLTEGNLRRLVRFCKEQRKLLILDACFRAYLPRHMIYDQYQLVLDAGIDAVVIEDTGKTWPTCEIKAPFFAVTRARGLFDRIYGIYTDFLLHVSPVGIQLMHEFVRLSQQDEMASVHEVVRVNRETLYESIAGTFLTPCEKPFASVSWLHIDHGLSGQELKRILGNHGVFVLPGHHFFWHDRRRGDPFIRVALTRDAEVFREAARLLGDVCRKVASSAKTPALTGQTKLIANSAAVRRDLTEQGFAWLPRSVWSIDPQLEPRWQRLCEDWDHLELDRFLENGAKFRLRRYGRYFWSPASDVLTAIPNEPYFQPKEENSYAGGIDRTFAPLLPDTVGNPFLHALVRATFACLPIDGEKLRNNWEVRIHQIRIVASPGAPAMPAPEGIHQDGTDFLTLHLVRRHNVEGGESAIYDLERRPVWKSTMRETLDSLILEDPRIMHGVTPLQSADGRQLGTRDLLGVDFLYRPHLEQPAGLS
jgi:aspartate/methionine/tyrosine aminotransferase